MHRVTSCCIGQNIFDYKKTGIPISLFHHSLPHQVVMDHHRSHSPNSSSRHHRSALRAERDDGGRNPSDNKHFRPNHHKHQTGPTAWQNPLSSQRLSTRKELYERDFPVYKQPVEVGCFSLDSKRRFFNDDRQLRYYVAPDRNPHFDLRDGYRDRYIQRDDGVKEKLDHMLRWILANRSKVGSTVTAASSW